MKLLLRLLLTPLAIFCPAVSAAVYHIDAGAGDDSRDGLAPESAWRSLDRVNREEFRPGDRVLFKSGTRHEGQLRPRGSGVEGNPIRIGRYGGGALPRIDGGGRVTDTVLIRNVSFWEIEELEVTNQGERREPWRTGVRVLAEDTGVMRHIRLRRLFVHDVNGDLRKSHEGCGIYFETKGREKRSRFDGLLVEDCHVVRTDRNGICQRNGSGPHSTGVVIRGNLLEDIGGDGIKVWGSDAPLIEHNVVRDGRMRCEDHAAGIWPFDCNDALIQFNEVSGMRGTKDGQGFDSDYSCRRSVFQYNYSHDNEGGFFLICGPGNSFNEDTVIRYNISRNDGVNTARVFHFGGGSTNTLVHNNTIHIGAEQDLPLFLFDTWDGGKPENVRVVNNIFHVEGRVTYEHKAGSGIVFENNVYHGNHAGAPADAKAVKTAALRNPAGAGDGFGTLSVYRPVDPATFPRGVVIPGNGGRDILGNVVPDGRPPMVGAIEAR